MAPKGLVNINFGTHNCVHMGTELDAETSAYEPSAVSWPAENDKIYTLVMLDHDSVVGGPNLHWMLINIPGTDIDKGQTIAEYNSPAPVQGTGPHRYVFVAMDQQLKNIEAKDIAGYVSKSCGFDGGRVGFDLEQFRKSFGMGEIVAANYFTVEYDGFVDSIQEFCSSRQNHHVQQQAHPHVS